MAAEDTLDAMVHQELDLGFQTPRNAVRCSGLPRLSLNFMLSHLFVIVTGASI